MKFMEKYYTTGKFAKLANVSERTLRYYDQVGLLKPSFVLENGYRQYGNQDLLRLQKILLLRKLGFSIDEIVSFLSDQNKEEDVLKSLQMQKELIDHRIQTYNSIKDSEWYPLLALKILKRITAFNANNGYHSESGNELE